ncbi:MAG: photosystem II protein Psb27 [Cyanobium sp. MED195]|nr:photosystem II protein Psb27 [Cyanobium sp. MED195]
MIAVLKRLSSRLINVSLALCLGLSLLVTACGNESSTLSGDYVQDTVAVAHSIHDTLELPQDAANRKEAEGEARDLINDYVSRYRSRPKVNGLSSFTTMQTALNSLAGHYNNYTNRPVPDALRARIEKEMGKAEKAAVRGT